MIRKLIIAASLLIVTPAFGQSVQYVSPVTRNTVPVWNTNGVIAGGVTSADSPVTSFGVTNNGGSGICVNSGRVTAAGYQALCFGANTNGPATISLQNYGTAPQETLQFVVNGTTYPFPGSLANITVGTTPVVGGTNGQCLFVSSGLVGQQNCTLSAITSLTGDITATGPGISVATLATVNGTPGTFGSNSVVPVITVNSKGLITNVSTSTFGLTVGTSTITSGTTNGLLYDNGGLLGNLSTLGNGVLVTNSGGVPAINTTLPTGLTIPTPTFTGTLTLPDSATWSSTGISKVAALSVGSATLPSGGNISISGLYEVNGTQIAASNLSNGATGSGAVVLAASPAISGTWTGNAGFSGNITHSGQLIATGTSAPSSAAGNTVVMGTITSPTLTNTGQAFLYNTLVNGAIIEGDGSTNDVSIFNKSGALVAGVPTGTTKLNFPSLASGTCSSGLGLDSGNNTILISCPGAASSIQVGTTTITSGTGGNIEFNNAGTLGEVTPGNGLAIVSTTLGLTAARRTLPTYCNGFPSNVCPTSGSGTYTTPANVLWLEIGYCGGGGGGGGAQSGTGPTIAGSVGTLSAFNSINAAPGGGGLASSGGSGTSAPGGVGGTSGSGTATRRMPGSPGTSGGVSATLILPQTTGGSSVLFGGGGSPVTTATGNGNAGGTNTGGGGSGAINTAVTDNNVASGGGAGECVYLLINSPSATYSFSIGPGGAGGSSTNNGGAGAAGGMYSIEHYGT